MYLVIVGLRVHCHREWPICQQTASLLVFLPSPTQVWTIVFGDITLMLSSKLCVISLPSGGQVQVIRSDNGTNLVGAEQELKQALEQWNSSQAESFLLQKAITCIFNAPDVSHHGRSWERLLRSTWPVLCGLMKEQMLTDNSFTTLFTEVESILNS